MEFFTLDILGIFQTGNIWNFKIANFTIFPNWTLFGIFQVDNFSNFSNWQFSEFVQCEILGTFQIGMFQIANFSNLLNCKFFEFSELKNLQIDRIFLIWKIKIWLKKLVMLELFAHSIFRITRNFANSHIFPLI